jgi:hypothetical protein
VESDVRGRRVSAATPMARSFTSIVIGRRHATSGVSCGEMAVNHSTLISREGRLAATQPITRPLSPGHLR